MSYYGQKPSKQSDNHFLICLSVITMLENSGMVFSVFPKYTKYLQKVTKIIVMHNPLRIGKTETFVNFM